MIFSVIQHFEADFLWKFSLKILNSGIILKTLTHAIYTYIGEAVEVYICSRDGVDTVANIQIPANRGSVWRKYELRSSVVSDHRQCD